LVQIKQSTSGETRNAFAGVVAGRRRSYYPFWWGSRHRTGIDGVNDAFPALRRFLNAGGPARQ